jgi:hypothetical protein
VKALVMALAATANTAQAGIPHQEPAIGHTGIKAANNRPNPTQTQGLLTGSENCGSLGESSENFPTAPVLLFMQEIVTNE